MPYKRVNLGLCFLFAVITNFCLVTIAMVTETLIFKNLFIRSLLYSHTGNHFAFYKVKREQYINYEL